MRKICGVLVFIIAIGLFIHLFSPPSAKKCFELAIDMPLSEISNLRGGGNLVDGCAIAQFSFTSEHFPRLKHPETYHDMNCFAVDYSPVSDIFRHAPRSKEEKEKWKAQLQCKHSDTQINNDGTKMWGDKMIIYDRQSKKANFYINE